MHLAVGKKIWVFALIMVLLAMWARVATGQDADGDSEPVGDGLALVIDVQGPIGPATRDFVSRSLETAAEREAVLMVIRLDTPGGLDASTRDIIKAILNSEVPVATWVAPEGARAASAGTYILYASHLAVMSPATNVGAATPVAMIGGSSPPRGKSPLSLPDESVDDSDPQESDTGQGDAAEGADAMMKKTINDSVAYIRGLAELRGRNADWAERAVREADSITSEEALEMGVIDFIAGTLGELLQKADGMTVEVNDFEQTLATSALEIDRLEPDWRNDLLGVITSPTIAYILLLIGVYGLILEGYNPGAIVPGVVGAICLLMALYALQMLPVNYAGLALIVLGIILMIAEVMAPSFGALGFGGIIAIVVGSIILIDTDVPGFAVSRPLIGSIATVGALGLMTIIWFAVRARQRPVVAGREQMLGAQGVALDDFEGAGEVFIHSERWSAVSDTPLRKNQAVEVTAIDGLTLAVRPVSEQPKEQNDV
jgi:membrane-bound serine protease (ClpP class)